MITVVMARAFFLLKRISVGVFFISPTALAVQNATTNLYIQPVPYYMESVEQGTYVELVERFSRENNYDFEIVMASSERIEKLLSRGEKDFCSLGFSVELAKTEGLPTKHLIESQSFNRIYTSILSLQESKIERVEELNNKTLVVFHGNYQDAKQRIPKEIETSIVANYSMDSIINIIVKGRVDAGFVTTPDIYMSPLYQQSQSQLHLVELPNSNRRESLVCFDSIENRNLMSLFNQYIDKLKTSGELNDYIDYK